MLDPARPATTAPSVSFRWLAGVTLALMYVLIVVGGVVRVTGSGDACPDWPRCHGQLLPPLQTDVLIEFSHRIIASVVGFLVLATAIAAWRSQRHQPVVFWGAIAAVGMVAGQIVLGGVTVLSDLSPGLVTAHLAVASALLATLVAITWASLRDNERRGQPASDATSFRNLAVLVALATFALILTGAYVRGTGAALAFRDWPLFDGQLLPEGGRLAIIHATHRLATLIVGLLVAYLAVRAWSARSIRRPVLWATALAVGIYVAQALVGAANIWTLLQPAATGAHLALAMALWATLVSVALLAHSDVRVIVGTAGRTRVPETALAEGLGGPAPSVPAGRAS